MIKVTYDPEVDILTIVWSDSLVEESNEAEAGIVMDYDSEGHVIGLEILDASKRMDNPLAVQYAILKRAS